MSRGHSLASFPSPLPYFPPMRQKCQHIPLALLPKRIRNLAISLQVQTTILSYWD